MCKYALLFWRKEKNHKVKKWINVIIKQNVSSCWPHPFDLKLFTFITVICSYYSLSHVNYYIKLCDCNCYLSTASDSKESSNIAYFFLMSYVQYKTVMYLKSALFLNPTVNNEHLHWKLLGSYIESSKNE